ncbi:MAG: MBL fold metallo-hydrolase [Spirochaetaceae bacterium]|nr:MBL fold metallo-hydrolase [Spirochaetaceae bacterium]
MINKTAWKESEGLRLQSKGGLELFFVGVGSAFTKKNFQNNLLVLKGNDHVLIDCGTLCPLALSEFGRSIMDIQNFIITHSHADHIGGLEEAALMDRYVRGSKPNMVINDRYKKILWDYSLKGGSAYGESRQGWMKFEDYFNQLKPKKFKGLSRECLEYQLGSINVKLFRTNHIPDVAPSWKQAHISYGVLIDDKIFFSSDTKFDRELLDDFLQKFPVEYIFHDCQLYTGGVHSSIQELSKLPKDIKSKMILCHYGDNVDDFNAVDEGFIEFAQRGYYYSFE